MIPFFRSKEKYKAEPIRVDKKPIYKKPVVKGGVTAPMAGRIVEIKVNVGDKVNFGDPVVILEAMKMMNEVGAIRSGTIKEIKIKEGMGVKEGDALVIIN